MKEFTRTVTIYSYDINKTIIRDLYGKKEKIRRFRALLLIHAVISAKIYYIVLFRKYARF